ncbi:DUF3048 domain-containing protein [Aeromicrobium endophyticum]|uniref:DUF3048 domain-containing protein n=2 Tax=Aeromicrobium endophyticum TaxID=2292704 RepID=A0A371P893_9ACTN|nr:DUF3048 domain-containing protein [Aeromicrobium endophyticum]
MLAVMKLRMIAAVSAAALTLTACSSSSDDTKKADAPDATASPAAPVVPTSPLTGLEMRKGRPGNPVFVVKIENTSAGAPQYGLDKADLVLEELVEGGLTRLAAFFYSSIPSKVGHVRSLRTSDIGIAGPVGGQLVASGGAAGAYNKVEKGGITVFSEDAGSPGFSSDPAKYRPYNRLINLKTVAKEAKGSKVKRSYLPFTKAGAAPSAATGKPAQAATVRFSNSTSTSWKLDGEQWVRTNGHAAPGKDFKADTMIVVFARVGDAGYTDPAGNPVPETVFKGEGEAMVFHGGQVDTVTWKKPSLNKALTFTASDGSDYTIDPGKVFIELVPKGAGSVTLG